MTTPRWGTLEELLLACAVNRYGTNDWDSIAMEVQSRCFDPPFSFSPQDCRTKFNDLKIRFMFRDHDDLAGMVDELRRIRVEELRREVQRRDGSIVLLELKLKRLEEERERSLKEESMTDLKDDRDGCGAGRKSLRSIDVVNSVSVEDTDDRRQRFFPESNSSKKDEVEQNGVFTDQAKLDPREPKPVRTATESERKRPFINGSNNIEEEEEEHEEEHGASAGGTDRLGESFESDGESKREENKEEEEDSKHQSSDVQSSASLSRQKRRRRNGAGAGAGADEEVEGHDASPAIKRHSDLKSEPLVKLLEILNSHQLGSMIERRLQSQESKRYKSLIRQHMDLQIIKSRLEKGIYSNSDRGFFRDLLLLYNNVIVFFHTTSLENSAALQLRALVMEEMKGNDKFRTSTKAPTLVPCRKRGSINGSGRVDEKERKDGSLMNMPENGTRAEKSKSSKNGEVKHEYDGGDKLSAHAAMDVKKAKKELTAKQKQGAVRFLKRMRQNSQGEEEEEEKKSLKRKEEGRGEGNSKVKRGKGRPPKQQGSRPAENEKGERRNGGCEVAVAVEAVAGGGGRRPQKQLRRR